MGLKRDGTVVITEGATERKIDVSDWTDIVAIAAGEYFAIGLEIRRHNGFIRGLQP